jgi:hypothetical protein
MGQIWPNFGIFFAKMCKAALETGWPHKPPVDHWLEVGRQVTPFQAVPGKQAEEPWAAAASKVCPD